MAMNTHTTQVPQMILTLEDNAMVSDIRKALKKAREESAHGETIVCNTPEEMQQYFDSL